MSFAFSATAHVPDIRAYGGVGDGVTDCGPAFRHALESVRHAGGGRIFIPPGRWRIQSSQHGYADPHSAAYWIANGESNIVIEGAGSASQLIVETPRLIGYDTSLFYSAPRYTINEALAGSTQIILSNPSDISHFSIGEIIFIRTGNVAGADAFGAPDSEFNVVTGLDSNTGAITVSTPLSKDYQVEYYPPGGDSTLRHHVKQHRSCRRAQCQQMPLDAKRS